MLVHLWLKNALFLNELKFLNVPLKVGHFLRIHRNLWGNVLHSHQFIYLDVTISEQQVQV